MNQTIKIFTIAILIFSSVFAFEDDFSKQVNKLEMLKDPMNTYFFSHNPANMLYKENSEVYYVKTVFGNNGYHRVYDAATFQNYKADYSTLRMIDESSFLLASITYDDLRMKDMYGSREKDFYDDYFSTIDSSGGNTAYYGPQLSILYNVKIADDLYFGVKGNYGVERGLKDTFPETITIMRNSTYHLGLDYRKESFGIGLHGRYYDDQTYYESVKSYSEVIPKTYMGYNVIYNESPSSTSKKKRDRNGLEYGGHVRLNKGESIIFTTGITGLYRSSSSEMYTSYSKPRGQWVRQGINLCSGVTVNPSRLISIQIDGEYLGYYDWGESLVTNTLILENWEKMGHLGLSVLYQPSMALKAYLGSKIGSVSYKYYEYIQSFEDIRSGVEWNVYGGTELYISSKTKLNINLEFGKEVPKFYWDIEYFQYTGVIINLEQLFSFGYIALKFENINKKPSNGSENISNMQFGLSYHRK
ncbi:MAG: hypothetical protein K9N05_02345 [Candidatus Marinimicrobia bacterium]|nr:hypothetical protein [Candidatus Neomarinimicrobiota bacterium]